MRRRRIERRLDGVSRGLRRSREELRVNEEQLTVVADEAAELGLRALVSDDPMAERDHRRSERHAERLRRDIQAILERIGKLEDEQDALLDRLGGC